MYSSRASRLNRTSWGEHVDFNEDYIQALAADLAHIGQAISSMGGNVNLTHQRIQWQPPSVPGLQQFAEELSTLFGRDDQYELEHQNRFTVSGTLENGATDGLVTISAFSNESGASPTALDVTGGVSITGNLALGSGNTITIGGSQITLEALDLTGISNYSASSVQLLGHDASGDLYWYGTSAC